MAPAGGRARDMMLVDAALIARQRDGRPVRVALVGAGFMGGGVAAQIVLRTPGMQLVGIVNRDRDRALRVLHGAGGGTGRIVEDAAAARRAVAAGEGVVTDDMTVLCSPDLVDVVCDATGAVEYGARLTLHALEQGLHVVTLNAELDGTVGPVLAARARAAGLVYTGVDGDQPGVEVNLVRFVRGIGMEPLVCGNVKGLHDPYRNPTTQEAFARRWGQDARMVTSFADGTKVSFEQAVVANATGMSVERRGMRGSEHRGHVDDLVTAYDVDALRADGGWVDYVVGAAPAPGVFVLAAAPDASSRHYLELYKLGTGPLYSFYTPYHLCHFEVPTSLARAVLFGDEVVASAGPARVEVVAAAKRDLPAGHVLDGLGGYDSYGLAEASDVVLAQDLLPMGLAEGCRLLVDVRRDQVLRSSEVELPAGRVADRLLREQRAA